MPHAIRLNDVFYTEASPNPWTADPVKAKTWESVDVPEGILAYWNKVHYQRTEVVEGKERVLFIALGGRYPKGAVMVQI